MIKISHEFPLEFYKNDFAKYNTDFDYCLIHRYLESEDYRNYFKKSVAEGRTVYIDNGLFELSEALGGIDFVNVINDLKPSFYVVPDVFDDYNGNLKSMTKFLNTYKPNSNPIVVAHGKTPSEIIDAVRFIGAELELRKAKGEFTDFIIALPFASSGFSNDFNPMSDGRIADPNFYNPDNIQYKSLRQALNRKKFVKLYKDILSKYKIHLLGCKSVAEFDSWDNFDKEFIYSLDTSIPVAMSLEGKDFSGTTTIRDPYVVSLDNHYYKPEYLIDKHFYDGNFQDEDLILNNIYYFQNRVRKWYNNE